MLYLLLGACAGVLAGLFGVGGGIIIVPVLVFSFTLQGFDASVLTHLAVGTSLATIVFTSINAVLEHHRKGAVQWPIFAWMTLGILLGAGVGAKTASLIQGPLLQKIIGVFALVIAAQIGPGPQAQGQSRHVPGNARAESVQGGVSRRGLRPSFRHRGRFADRAVPDLAQPAHAAGSGHVFGLWPAHCLGQCPEFHAAGLARRAPAGPQPGLRVLAGAGRHCPDQHVFRPLRRAPGAQAVATFVETPVRSLAVLRRPQLFDLNREEVPCCLTRR
ncbi:hypothetical protein PPS11_21419 [Pseudomonas putida S11]|nr:hypothetical protein PPS11_21419 [Pseudomonas putida S11]